MTIPLMMIFSLWIEKSALRFFFLNPTSRYLYWLIEFHNSIVKDASLNQNLFHSRHCMIVLPFDCCSGGKFRQSTLLIALPVTYREYIDNHVELVDCSKQGCGCPSCTLPPHTNINPPAIDLSQQPKVLCLLLPILFSLVQIWTWL